MSNGELDSGQGVMQNQDSSDDSSTAVAIGENNESSENDEYMHGFFSHSYYPTKFDGDECDQNWDNGNNDGDEEDDDIWNDSCYNGNNYSNYSTNYHNSSKTDHFNYTYIHNKNSTPGPTAVQEVETTAVQSATTTQNTTYSTSNTYYAGTGYYSGSKNIEDEESESESSSDDFSSDNRLQEKYNNCSSNIDIQIVNDRRIDVEPNQESEQENSNIFYDDYKDQLQYSTSPRAYISSDGQFKNIKLHLDEQAESLYHSPISLLVGYNKVGKTTLYKRLIERFNLLPGSLNRIRAKTIPINIDRKGSSGNLFKNNSVNNRAKVNNCLIFDKDGNLNDTNLDSFRNYSCDFVIYVLDIMGDLDQEIIHDIRAINNSEIRYIIVLNQIDKIPGWMDNLDLHSQSKEVFEQFQNLQAELQLGLAREGFFTVNYLDSKNYVREVPLIPVSARTGQGIDQLLWVISRLSRRYIFHNLILQDPEAMILGIEQHQLQKSINIADKSKDSSGHQLTYLLAILVCNGILRTGQGLILNVFPDNQSMEAARVIKDTKKNKKEAGLIKIKAIYSYDQPQNGKLDNVSTGLFLVEPEGQVDLSKANLELEQDIKVVEKEDIDKASKYYRNLENIIDPKLVNQVEQEEKQKVEKIELLSPSIKETKAKQEADQSNEDRHLKYSVYIHAQNLVSLKTLRSHLEADNIKICDVGLGPLDMQAMIEFVEGQSSKSVDAILVLNTLIDPAAKQYLRRESEVILLEGDSVIELRDKYYDWINYNPLGHLYY